MPDSVARGLAASLDRATYEGYRLGFEAARDEAALLAERGGHAALAEALRAMRPLPDKRKTLRQ
jgi:hypothetical protein